MKTNNKHLINNIGWLGIILVILLTIVTSCSKKSEVKPTPIPTTTNKLVGHYIRVSLKQSTESDSFDVYANNTFCMPIMSGSRDTFNFPTYTNKWSSNGGVRSSGNVFVGANDTLQLTFQAYDITGKSAGNVNGAKYVKQ